MSKHYKETPWYWYMAVLVFSFVLGLVVVIKENITLPVWGYIVALLVGIIIAPFVSISTYRSCQQSKLSDSLVEHHSLFSFRQWYRHEQPVENVGGSDAP